MKLSVSDAARLAGVSRQTLYDRINSGTLSKTSEGIDVVELARCYPELKPLESLKLKRVKNRKKSVTRTSETEEAVAAKVAEIEWLKKELDGRQEIIDRKDRELAKAAERFHESNQAWQEHMQGLRKDFTKLLEAPPEKPKGFFRRVFG